MPPFPYAITGAPDAIASTGAIPKSSKPAYTNALHLLITKVLCADIVAAPSVHAGADFCAQLGEARGGGRVHSGQILRCTLVRVP